MWIMRPPLFDRRARLLSLSERFAVALTGDKGSAVLMGAEHEYRVVVADERKYQVDFRRLIHGLRLGRRGLDPDDPYSYRLASGDAVTCDQKEAEIVLAPAAVAPDAS